jgi:hypothetical protein
VGLERIDGAGRDDRCIRKGKPGGETPSGSARSNATLSGPIACIATISRQASAWMLVESLAAARWNEAITALASERLPVVKTHAMAQGELIVPAP